MKKIQTLSAMNAQCMTSLEIAEVTVTQGKFSLSAYQDATGRTLPCYSLSKTECLYIATKFNDEARAKLVIRWEELELERETKGAHLSRLDSEGRRND